MAFGVVETEAVTDPDPGFFPIHAEPDSMLLQEPGEGLTGKLGALVGVKYLRSALLDRLL